ncbi:3-oxoacyl-(acyl-carrier protein) synthase [Plesiocystis pacifica SIR-1]|uniref:3-oxoacyl-(Acyl-carrier protein) synthase n=1 Tax=Plesiocystis pacifica SIR-1 TaxID=391625 RepID=A6G3M9_9BACT|nr:3-oxoacyl-[acyl-carrier-protein] synthase III C-terminal domain-containing protein [Plesiocystis pacifica]EDM79636.1 3-oxoacyl-(acyl-carrier protein) synthase [Plesiocystis pacifica SIR-1]
MSTGIVGIGTYLPEQVRHNDYWSPELVAGWRGRVGFDNWSEDRIAALNPGQRAVLTAVQPFLSDPFRGCLTRRVKDPGVSSPDMQAAAAKQALERAGVEPGQVGVVISNSLAPTYLGSADAFAIHAQLGLPSHALAFDIEAACNALAHQWVIARGMIESGAVDYALLTQAALGSVVVEYEAEYSPWFGDGASAVLLGRVEGEGEGLLSCYTETDGKAHGGVIIGPEEGSWTDGGRPRLRNNTVIIARTFLNMCNSAKLVLDRAQERAGVRADEVSFFACHQGQIWMSDAIRDFGGIGHAKSFNTLSEFGNLLSVNIPLALRMAHDAGLLEVGDLVQTYAIGSGHSESSLVFRWDGC